MINRETASQSSDFENSSNEPFSVQESNLTNGSQEKEIVKDPRTPIFIHAGSGMVFHDGGGEQIPPGAKRKIVAAFAHTTSIDLPTLREYIAESNSIRTPGTVIRELNLFFKKHTKDEQVEDQDVFVVEDNRGKKKSERTPNTYKRTRDIYLLEDHELAWAAVVFPDINLWTTHYGAASITDAETNPEHTQPPTVKPVCDTLGVYKYNHAYIKIPPGEEHAIWMLLLNTPHQVISNRELEHLIDEPDPVVRKAKLHHKLQNLSDLIASVEGKNKAKEVFKHTYNARPREHGIQLQVNVERESTQTPPRLDIEQAAIIGNIFALRNNFTDGLPLKIGREKIVYKLDKDIVPVIDRLRDGYMKQTDISSEQREKTVRNRALAVETIRQFFTFSAAMQELFIRSHGNEDVKKFLRWMRDENERGDLQGIVHPFLVTDPAGEIKTDLYDDIEKTTVWIAPSEAIAARIIKRKQRSSSNGQKLLVSFT